MAVNMGTIDRVVRIVVGLLLIAWAIPIGFSEGGWNWIGWIGIVPLATGAIGSCPAYTLLGFSTCPMKRV
jgi:hypothetical protein